MCFLLAYNLCCLCYDLVILAEREQSSPVLQFRKTLYFCVSPTAANKTIFEATGNDIWVYFCAAMKASVWLASCAVSIFGQQRASFYCRRRPLWQRRGIRSCGLHIFSVLTVNIHYQSFQACACNYSYFLRRCFISLNQLHPPSPSTFTLGWSGCNFSISARPHRKCIHPNNHMFSNKRSYKRCIV